VTVLLLLPALTQLLLCHFLLFFRGISTTGFAEKEDFVRALVESAKL
jgi:hypothetical protein